jgi:hypothetical protein
MTLLASSFISSALDHWQTADATDYGVMALTVVVLGWFISRYYTD